MLASLLFFYILGTKNYYYEKNEILLAPGFQEATAQQEDGKNHETRQRWLPTLKNGLSARFPMS